MVVGPSGHWRSPWSQALPRASAPSKCVQPAHPVSKHAVTLLAPMQDGAGGDLGTAAPRLPLPVTSQRAAVVTAPHHTAPPSLNHDPLSPYALSVGVDAVSGHAASTSASGGAQTPNPRGALNTSSPRTGATQPAPPDPAALTSWIKSSQTISRLQRLLRQYGSQMNHIHVSAVVTHLSQLAADDPATAAVLSAAAAADAPSSPCPINPGSDQSASAEGQQLPSDGTDAAAAGSSARSPDPNAIGPSYPSAAAVREFLATLLARVHGQLPYFEPRQLGNTAWALGKWPPGLAGRDEALAAVLQAAAPQLHRFRAQELANLLHGWATSAAAAHPVAAPLGPAGTQMAGWLPAPTSSDPRVAQSLKAVRGQQLQEQQVHPQALFSAHARACVPLLRQGRFKMQELSNLLWAWGLLLGGVTVGGARAEGASVWAAGSAPPPAGALAVPYRELLAAQMHLGLETAGPQELANSMLSLARLQVLPPPEWFDAFLEACRRHLVAAGGAGVMPVGQPPPRLPRPPPSAASQRLGFSPQELSNLLWGCSKLRLPLPHAFLDDVASALERSLPAMGLQERVNVLWALAWQAKLGSGAWGVWDGEEGTAGEETFEAGAGAEADVAATGPQGSGLGPGPDSTASAFPGEAGGPWTGTLGKSGPPLPHPGGPDAHSGVVERRGPRGFPASRSAAANAREGAAELSGSGPPGERDGAGSTCGGQEGGTTAPGWQPGAAAAVAAAAATPWDGSRGGAQAPGPGRNRQAAGTRTEMRSPPSRGGTAGAGDGAAGDGPRAAAHGGYRWAGNSDQGELAARRKAGEDQHERQLTGALPDDVPSMESEVHPARRCPDLEEPALGASARVGMVRQVVLAVLDPLRRSPAVAAPQDVSVALWSVATLAGARAAVAGGVGDGGDSDSDNERMAAAGGPQNADAAAVAGGKDGIGEGSSACEGGRVLVRAAEEDLLVRLWGRWLAEMSPQGQANCVWAAARLRLRLPSELQGRLAAWLARRAGDLSPAETAAVLRSLGQLSSQLRPSADMARAAVALTEQTYLRHGRYELGELVQACHGGAMLLRWLERARRAAAAASDEASYEEADAGESDGEGMQYQQQQLMMMPAATAIRMSAELAGDAGGGGGGSGWGASSTAAAVYQRRVAQSLDALLVRLQQAYGRTEGGGAARPGAGNVDGIDGAVGPWNLSPAMGLEALVMTLEAVAVALPNHVSPTRGSELSTWCQDLVHQHARRALTQAPHHVRSLAPLLHACAAAAVSSVRVARARKLAAAERMRRGGGGGGWLARSSMDEFTRSGRLAQRRAEVLAVQKAPEKLSGSSELQTEEQQPEGRRDVRISPEGRRAEVVASPAPPASPQQHQQQHQQAQVAPPSTAPLPVKLQGVQKHAEEQQLHQLQQPSEGLVAQHSQQQPHQQPRQQPQPQPQPGPSGTQVMVGPLPQSASWAASGLTHDWLQRFWTASAPSLSEAAPQEAAMMLWAMSALAVQPPDLWVRALLRAVQPHLRHGGRAAVSDQTLGVLLFSLGHLRVRPSAPWMAAALQAVDDWAGAANSGGGGSGSAASGAPAAHGLVREMDPDAVLGVLCGLALLEWPLPAEWLARLVRAVAPQLGRMRAGERTRAYMAVASLDAGLAERVGFEFSELLVVVGGRAGRRGASAAGGAGHGNGGGGAGGREWERVEEGAAQQRTLFTRARGGW